MIIYVARFVKIEAKSIICILYAAATFKILLPARSNGVVWAFNFGVTSWQNSGCWIVSSFYAYIIWIRFKHVAQLGKFLVGKYYWKEVSTQSPYGWVHYFYSNKEDLWGKSPLTWLLVSEYGCCRGFWSPCSFEMRDVWWRGLPWHQGPEGHCSGGFEQHHQLRRVHYKAE